MTPWSKLVVTERLNRPGSVEAHGRQADLAPFLADDPTDAELTCPGLPDWTGLVTRIEESWERVENHLSPQAVVTLTSDDVRLWETVAYPGPAKRWATQTADYCTLTGPAEWRALELIRQNVRDAGDPARQRPWVINTSHGWGPSATSTYRFDLLGQAIADLLDPIGVRLTVARGVVTTRQGRDLTARARYSPTARRDGPLTAADGAKVVRERPSITAALVAGSGQLSARSLRERTDTESAAIWGRIETFLDQRQTGEEAELDAAGDKALVDGAKPVTITANLTSTPGLVLGRDVLVGDLVEFHVSGRVYTERVRMVTTSYEKGSVTRTATIGADGADLTTDQKRWIASRRDLRKVQSQ